MLRRMRRLETTALRERTCPVGRDSRRTRPMTLRGELSVPERLLRERGLGVDDLGAPTRARHLSPRGPEGGGGQSSDAREELGLGRDFFDGLTSTPRPLARNSSHSCRPSTRSMGGAPSRTASRSASLVKRPVVMNKPLSALPTFAPRKIPYGTGPNRLGLPLALEVDVKRDQIDAQHAGAVDAAVAGLPVTSTFTKPYSRRRRWHSRSKADGAISRTILSNPSCHDSSLGSPSSPSVDWDPGPFDSFRAFTR